MNSGATEDNLTIYDRAIRLRCPAPTCQAEPGRPCNSPRLARRASRRSHTTPELRHLELHVHRCLKVQTKEKTQ